MDRYELLIITGGELVCLSSNSDLRSASRLFLVKSLSSVSETPCNAG